MEIHITPDNVFSVDRNKQEKINDLHNYLWWPVILEEGVNLRRLFELVKPLAELWGIILNENVVDLIEEIGKESSATNSSDIEKLVITWQAERNFETQEVYIVSEFFGKKENTNYALEYTPVNELTNIPVIIKSDLYVHDETDINVEPDYYGKLSFKVIEMYKAIFYELSFFGSPEERKAALTELNGTIKEIENGTAELHEITIEELKKDLF